MQFSHLTIHSHPAWIPKLLQHRRWSRNKQREPSLSQMQFFRLSSQFTPHRASETLGLSCASGRDSGCVYELFEYRSQFSKYLWWQTASEQLCSVIENLKDLGLFMQCSNWYPLYENTVYNAMCYSGTEGFAWVAHAPFSDAATREVPRSKVPLRSCCFSRRIC